MGNKSIYYDLFNDKISEFLRDLIQSFPDITEFKKFKSGLNLVINVDPSSTQVMFNSFVVSKYKNAILSKDDVFFLEDEDIDVGTNRKDYWINFINQLKSLWKTIDKNNKDIIWKYLHVLCILSDKCQNIK
jgi:calcineurin-like phosphoesterase family protein